MEYLLLLGGAYLASKYFFGPPLPKNQTRDDHVFDPRDARRARTINETGPKDKFITDKEWEQGVDEDRENPLFDQLRYSKFPSAITVQRPFNRKF